MAGTLDNSFGTSGGWTSTIFNPGSSSAGQVKSCVTDSMGRIVVTGSTSDPTNSFNQLVVARYTVGGILDTTFGTNGWTASTFNAGKSSVGFSLVLDSTGKIIVCGYTRDSNDTVYQVLVARYTDNGILDTTFGTNGWTANTFNSDQSSEGRSLVLDSTGKIIVIGFTVASTTSYRQLLIARYTTNGILDTTFGTNGWTATTFNAGKGSEGQWLSLDSTGKILVTGFTIAAGAIYSKLLVARYTSNGILDTTFGTNGWTATTFYGNNDAFGMSVVLDSTGKIRVSGHTVPTGTSYNQLIVVGYTSNGILDTTFGTNGWTGTTFYTGNGSEGTALVLDNNDRILITGSTLRLGLAASLLLIARYTANGILDTTFGTDGWTATAFYTNKNAYGYCLLLDNTGEILVSGNTINNSSVNELLIAKYFNEVPPTTTTTVPPTTTTTTTTTTVPPTTTTTTTVPPTTTTTTTVPPTTTTTTTVPPTTTTTTTTTTVPPTTTTTTTVPPTTTTTTTVPPITTTTTTTIAPNNFTNVQFSMNAPFSLVSSEPQIVAYIAELKYKISYYTGAPLDTITVISITPGSIVNQVRLPTIYVPSLQYVIQNGLFEITIEGGIYLAISSSFVILDNICFNKGTMILTPTGYKTIESLKSGDLVKTARGLVTRIQSVTSFIGKADKCPLYLLKKNSLGTNKPAMDLYMSEGHAYRHNGNWCHMKCSSASVKLNKDNVEYYNIALDNYLKHTLVANGLEVESLFKMPGLNMKWTCEKDNCKPVITRTL
jgi:uncharacterized delta-60 repeat protein